MSVLQRVLCTLFAFTVITTGSFKLGPWPSAEAHAMVSASIGEFSSQFPLNLLPVPVSTIILAIGIAEVAGGAGSLLLSGRKAVMARWLACIPLAGAVFVHVQAGDGKVLPAAVLLVLGVYLNYSAGKVKEHLS